MTEELGVDLRRREGSKQELDGSETTVEKWEGRRRRKRIFPLGASLPTFARAARR